MTADTHYVKMFRTTKYCANTSYLGLALQSVVGYLILIGCPLPVTIVFLTEALYNCKVAPARSLDESTRTVLFHTQTKMYVLNRINMPSTA